MVKIVQIFLLVPRIKSKAKQKLSVDLCRRLREGKNLKLKTKKNWIDVRKITSFSTQQNFFLPKKK